MLVVGLVINSAIVYIPRSSCSYRNEELLPYAPIFLEASITLPSLYLRHSSFSQPFFRFSYVTGSSLTSPGEPPMI